MKPLTLGAGYLWVQEKMRGERGRLPVQPLGYVMSTKVIFRRAKVIVLAGLSSETSACRPTSVWCLKEKQRLHVMADEVDLTSACGRLGRQTSARLKITFANMTYPGQRPEPPSLSPHFLLVGSNGPVRNESMMK